MENIIINVKKLSLSTDENDPNLFGPLTRIYIFALTLYSAILINNLVLYLFPSCAIPWDEVELEMQKVLSRSY